MIIVGWDKTGRTGLQCIRAYLARLAPTRQAARGSRDGGRHCQPLKWLICGYSAPTSDYFLWEAIFFPRGRRLFVCGRSRIKPVVFNTTFFFLSHTAGAIYICPAVLHLSKGEKIGKHFVWSCRTASFFHSEFNLVRNYLAILTLENAMNHPKKYFENILFCNCSVPSPILILAGSPLCVVHKSEKSPGLSLVDIKFPLFFRNKLFKILFTHLKLEYN